MESTFRWKRKNLVGNDIGADRSTITVHVDGPNIYVLHKIAGRVLREPVVIEQKLMAL